MNKFNSSKEKKRHLSQKKKNKKIKMNQFIIKTVISTQTREIRIACGYLGDSFVMNQSKPSFRRPRRSPFVFWPQ